jgi:hypothetical protein
MVAGSNRSGEGRDGFPRARGPAQTQGPKTIRMKVHPVTFPNPRWGTASGRAAASRAVTALDRQEPAPGDENSGRQQTTRRGARHRHQPREASSAALNDDGEGGGGEGRSEH